jgi:tetratricopeptide (TPR) repeat protein
VATRTALALALLLGSTAVASAQTDRQLDLRLELRRIESMERAGQLDDAAVALEEMLRLEPALPGAILTYERVCRRLGRLERALPFVARAIETDPGSVLLRQVELRVLSELGRTDDLRAAGERWLVFTPRSDAAYEEFASALQRIGDAREAERVLRLGAENSDRPVAMASKLADFYLNQERWSEMAEQWLMILRASPSLGWDLINFKLESAGPDAGQAAAALLEQLSDEREDERKLAAIAALYAGKPREARERAESLILELEPRERQAFINRFVEVAADRVQPGLVAWAYRQLLLDVPGDTTRWDLARRIVQNDLSAGDTASAIQVLEGLVDERDTGTPGHRWASGMLIRLQAARGDLEDAEHDFRAYASHYSQDPDFPELALTIAEANVARGRLNEASTVLDLVSRGGLDRTMLAQLATSRGHLALYTGRYEEARAELEVAAATLTGEQRGQVLRLLGLLRSANGQELEAVAAAHRAMIEGRGREAARLLSEGLETGPASAARPALLLWAGELAVAAGALETAEQALRGIPDSYPSSGEAPIALIRLAETLVAAGRQPEAIEQLERLILDYPDSALTPLGRRRLAELRQQVPRS